MADGSNGYIHRQQIYIQKNVEHGTPELGLDAKVEKRPRPAKSIIRCKICDVHLCLNSNNNWLTEAWQRT